jgi:hypothetical protein
MEFTTNNQTYLNQSAVGYMVNTLLSESSKSKIKDLQETFTSEFQNAIWPTPADTLHITLFDWLAPLVNYNDDKDRIFEKIHPEYDAVLSSILTTVKPIDVTFNRLIISPSAIAIATDEESTHAFNDIRQRFLAEIDLLPNTKQPPAIVHGTIARFVGEIALDDVKRVAKSLDVAFIEQVTGFQLVRETRLPMLDYSVIKKYTLNS